MVGWLKLQVQGASVATMGDMLVDELDFCSMGCLTNGVNEMAGMRES